MKVQISGITSLEDAIEAAALEIDALGFIFTKSKRQIDSEIIKPEIKEPSINPFRSSLYSTLGLFLRK